MRYVERDPIPEPFPGMATRTYDSLKGSSDDSVYNECSTEPSTEGYCGVFGRGWRSVFDAYLRPVLNPTDWTVKLVTESGDWVMFDGPFPQGDNGYFTQVMPQGQSGEDTLQSIQVGDLWEFVYRKAGSPVVRTYKPLWESYDNYIWLLEVLEDRSTVQRLEISHNSHGAPDGAYELLTGRDLLTDAGAVYVSGTGPK
jgi:hypothetical protein